jgi:hypothetical protein
MPIKPLGNPPIRESIVDENGFPKLGFAKWLSNLVFKFTLANDSANTTTADATDLATVITLANQLKTDLNDLKTKLRAAGIIS